MYAITFLLLGLEILWIDHLMPPVKSHFIQNNLLFRMIFFPIYTVCAECVRFISGVYNFDHTHSLS